MRREPYDLKGLISEYKTVIFEARVSEIAPDVDWPRLAHLLVNSSGWTPNGAQELVMITRGYGIFMLRNALALALALGLEDGELGY